MSSNIPFKLSKESCKRLYDDNSKMPDPLSISSKVYPIITGIAKEYAITLTELAIATAIEDKKTTLQECHLP